MSCDYILVVSGVIYGTLGNSARANEVMWNLSGFLQDEVSHLPVEISLLKLVLKLRMFWRWKTLESWR